MATMTGPTGELSYEVSMIDVTTSVPQPDKSWRFTDVNGHEHYWQDGYPTLSHVPDGERYWDDDDGEWYQPTRLACSVCGVGVTPRTTVDTFRRMAPGLSYYTFNGEPITKERFEEIQEEWRAARG